MCAISGNTQRLLVVQSYTGGEPLLDPLPPETLIGKDADHPQSVLDLHNTQSGRIFILGTGPSLLKQDLSKLKDEATFCCNTMPLWEKLPFTPTYYGITDIYEEETVDKWARLMWYGTIAFNVQWPGFYNNKRFIHVEKAHDSHQFRAEGITGLDDILRPLRTGRTTPLTLVQLALWMGYREIYFLGIEQTRGYCHDPKAVVSGASKRKNDFPLDKNPKYRIAVKQCAERMRNDIEEAGGEVYDCSTGGLLNITGKGIHTLQTGQAYGNILEYRDLAEVLDV